jgi:tetratricopeptide (TPR) repeat protein
MGEVIRQYRHHPHHGRHPLTQERVGAWMRLTQAQLSRIENRPPIVHLDRLIDWARTLGIPGDLLWFELPDGRPGRPLDGKPGRPPDEPPSARTPAENGKPTPCPGKSGPEVDYCAPVEEFLDGVDHLVEADVHRRQALMSLPFVLSALHEPTRNWLLSALVQAPSGGGRMDRAGLQQIRQMVDTFAELDAQQGGGHGRQALAQYLRTTVLPMLKTEDDENTRRTLFDLAGEQSQLLGWMSFDTAQYGLAERYLVQALRFSTEADNPVLGSHTLATLSHLATTLGNPAEGVQLARTGQAALQGRSNAMYADLAVLESRSHALLGDARKAAGAVHRAERALRDVVTADEPPEMRFIDHAYIAGEIANTLVILGDAPRAIDFAEQSIASSLRQGRARRGALSNVVLAEAHLARRDLDGACEAGASALRLSADVDSARTTQALQKLKKRLGRHPRSERTLSLVREIDRAAI